MATSTRSSRRTSSNDRAAGRPLHEAPVTARDDSGDDLNFVLRDRRASLDALIAAGVAPFAYRFVRSHTAAAAIAALGDAADGPAVQVAGRLVALRAHGKTTFAHLADASGRVQLYFRQDVLGPAYDLVSRLDLGDNVGVSGPLFRTRTGEPTVRAEQVEL